MVSKVKFGVYDTDWSAAGGWRLLKVFDTFYECQVYIETLPKSECISYDIKGVHV